MDGALVPPAQTPALSRTDGSPHPRRRPPPEEDDPETWGDKASFTAAFDAWATLWQPRLPAPTAKACIPLEPADGDATRRQKQLELFRRSVSHIRARDEAARLQAAGEVLRFGPPPVVQMSSKYQEEYRTKQDSWVATLGYSAGFPSSKRSRNKVRNGV